MRQKYLLFILSIVTGLHFTACHNNKREDFLFEALESNKTGIEFANTLTSFEDFNMFTYMYFFNGAGVGAADFNNDGLIDLFFAANQVQSKLYINKGNMKFEDVTSKSGIIFDKSWRTGVSVVDINQDGLMDIYVSKVGNYGRLQSKNELWVCLGIGNGGIPYYENQAAKYQLDFSTFGTQSVFFDYDLDGDLDMYLMNHSLRFSGTFNKKSYYDNQRDSLAGDRLLNNQDGRFRDVSIEAGILGNIIGYGLGINVSDINMDGWPDIYIANDFHENDYLYLNNQDGTFKEVNTEMTTQTSQFSMGVDIADLNSDGFPEILTVDMLPSEPYLLKRSLGEDRYDVFYHKLKSGYHPQFTRNTLQYNRKGQYFTEAGRYSGIQATDWSWSALLFDFENDGNKDIFISNGIPKRMNDIDYVKFIGDETFQKKIRENAITGKELDMVNKFPEIKLPNRFYRNIGDLQFSDLSTSIKNNKSTFSNGAVYADLDNDGDLDIVVNNIADKALIYENIQDHKKNKWLQLSCEGNIKNRNATGSKVLVFSGKNIRSYENTCVRGFMSSMSLPFQIGFGEEKPDSAYLIWPDNTFDKIALDSLNRKVKKKYRHGLPRFDYRKYFNYDSPFYAEIVGNEKEVFPVHDENDFNEFNREPLIPFMVSREGPAMAIGDMNGDGLDDIFMGSCKFDTSKLFLQTTKGKFKLFPQLAFNEDYNFEDVDAIIHDFNGDRINDLLVISGGNEYYGTSKLLKPRLYINQQNGQLIKSETSIPKEVMLTGSAASVWDYNNDNLPDIFIGGRAVPFSYGANPPSYILKNEGEGRFSIETSAIEILSDLGMVTDVKTGDVTGDKMPELIVSTEWGPVFLIAFDKGKFRKSAVTTVKGFWSSLEIADLDNDGRNDIVVGNIGLNNRFAREKNQEISLYLEDFDNNGQQEQIITYYLEGKEILLHNHEEILGRLPGLKKKFLFAEDFAKTNWTDIIPKNKIKLATKKVCNYFENVILYNTGDLHFEIQPLPWEMQLTSYKSFVITDLNQDGLADIIPGGNFHHNNIQLGRYDGEQGSVWINKGNRKFIYYPFYNQRVKGETRHVLPISVNREKMYLYARNDDQAILMKIKMSENRVK